MDILAIGFIVIYFSGFIPSTYAAAVEVSNEPSRALNEVRRTTSTQCFSDGTAKGAQKLSMLYGNTNAFYTLDGSDSFGNAVGGPGDIDGDGIVDLVVGAINDDDGNTNAGAVYIFFLQTDASIKNAQKLSSLFGNINAFYTFKAYDNFGRSVAALGDIDGDNVVDLAVGAFHDDDGSTDAGAIYLIYLETSGYAKSAQKLSMLHGNLNTFYTLVASDRFGSAGSALGDLDGDNVDDLAVGSFGDDDGGTNAGAIYVLFLRTDGTINNAQKVSNLHGNFGVFYTLGNNYFGHALGLMGDIDGDNVVELAVAEPNGDDGGTDAGAFFVLFLNVDGGVKGAQKVSILYSSFSLFYTLKYGDYFGQSLAVLGDIDGNGVVDLAVGSREDNDGGSHTGAVYVLFLRTDGDVSGAQKLSNTYGNLNAFYTIPADDKFGWAVTALGDIDGDGVLDFAAGSPHANDGSADAGAIYVVNLQQTYCETLSPTITTMPTPLPTPLPAPVPTSLPTPTPAPLPTPVPTSLPTPPPAPLPTPVPTSLPTPIPKPLPTPIPTSLPTPIPKPLPTPIPTSLPTPIPTPLPSPIPSSQPSEMTSFSPSLHPSFVPVSVGGTCYHHTSTVTRLTTNGKSAAQVPLTKVSQGDRILALDKHATPIFAKVESLPRGPSTEPFVQIQMAGKGKQGLKATMHHTFNTCVSKNNPMMHAVESYGTAVIQAKDIKAGDCLHTADGRRLVRSATHTAIKEGDVTYSIKVADGISAVAVGGVFTHAMGHVKEAFHGPISGKEKKYMANKASHM